MAHVHRARGAGCSLAGVMRAAAVSRGTGVVKGGMIVRLCAVVAVAQPVGLGAQTRELEHYGSGSPEGKLMLYYSSTVAFSPLGVPFGVTHPSATAMATGGVSSRFELSLEISYLPPLSAEQRTAGSDKPEATNLAPVFARPRLGARLPGGFALEMSWIPPFRVFDVKANLVAGALSRSFALSERTGLVPRVSFLTGRVEGPITCNSETVDVSADLATYYQRVCYGNDSQDYFEPRHLSGEVMVTRTSSSGRWQPYLTAGARGERTRFDVGVIRTDGSREPDQPILEIKTTRAYGAVGTSWFGVSHTRLAAEVYYAPGSVLTGRVLAGVRLW